MVKGTPRPTPGRPCPRQPRSGAPPKHPDNNDACKLLWIDKDWVGKRHSDNDDACEGGAWKDLMDWLENEAVQKYGRERVIRGLRR
jgi:hypothetical protein